MKKFTLSHAADSDSSRSVHSLHGSNDMPPEPDLPRITVLTIVFPAFNKKTCLKVIGDAVLLDIKRKLLKVFGSVLCDGQNMGLFFPGEGGKMGKFLEEERLLSEYACEKPEILLEFVYKRRMVPPISVTSPLVEKFSKDLTKAFLRYVTRGDCKKVQKILSKGFDPNFQCPKTGETPLTIAVTRSKPHDMISVLIAGGAHRDYYSKSGLTPLHKAAAARNFEAVKTLLDFGQSPNCRDQNGLTPLYVNILCDPDKRICHRLLYEHSELQVTNAEGLQEVHQAARLNRAEQINLLVMYGADVNSRCVRSPAQTGDGPTFRSTVGDTPLHVAAAAGQREAVLRLLSWGADPTLVNMANQTAIQIAQACGYADLAETIRLFRGDSDNGVYGGTFLPTPTYNPKRRMRNPPANSYITDPTALAPCATPITTNGPSAGQSRSLGPPSRPIVVSHSFDHRRDPPGATEVVHNQTNDLASIPKSILSRAVSMGELVQRGPPKGLKDEERLEVKRPSAVCNSFFLASQPYYDSTRDSEALTSCTLARRPKSNARTPALYCAKSQAKNPLDELPRRYANVQTPDFVKLCNDGPRHLNRLHRVTAGTTATKAVLQSWKSTDRLHEGFQREGSQTDSGISNSSAEKKPGMSPNSVMQGARVNDEVMKTSQSMLFSNVKLLHPNDVVGNTNGKCEKNYPTDNSFRPVMQSQHSRIKLDSAVDSPNVVAQSTVRPGVPHTVVLHKIDGTAQNSNDSRPSFGLSIRTVKNSDVIANFHPTTSKPSLQIAKRIVPNSPADRAGIREGDFVLKINGVDVTRAALEEVVKLLRSTVENSVCLTIMRPMESVTKDQSANSSQPRSPTNPSSISSSAQSHVYYSLVSASNPAHNAFEDEKRNAPNNSFVRPVDTSQPMSARSSDRTTCSSIPDEGIWSQSTGPSSNEVSARNSLVSRPRNLDTRVTLVPALRSPVAQKQLNTDDSQNRVRFRGLPRSRTTTGISIDQTNQSIPSSISQSLYFARNPRFRRVGSQDSQSSMSSGGPTNAHESNACKRDRIPLNRSTSSSTTCNPKQSGLPATVPVAASFVSIDSRQIRQTRGQLKPITRGTTTNGPHYRQRSVQPPISRNHLPANGFLPSYQRTVCASRADTPSTTVESLTDSEILLPPPVQFRS